jgi:hypothetical protein
LGLAHVLQINPFRLVAPEVFVHLFRVLGDQEEVIIELPQLAHVKLDPVADFGPVPRREKQMHFINDVKAADSRIPLA